jgi:putative ABC transport system permease protein
MIGILKIAFKLLVNDRAKFAALIVGITFAVFLMVLMTSIFAGILAKSSATVINIGARIWVMDPAVNTIANNIPMPDYVLNAVRSINGVKHAVPLYSGSALVKLASGAYQPVSVLGLDDASLLGRPELIEGRIEDIYGDNAFVVVRDEEFVKLENPTIGTTFELNDHRGVVVGIARVASSGLFGIPTIYTTYSRAVQYIPTTRFTIAYVLVEPKTSSDIPYIQDQVRQIGYLGLTNTQFEEKIATYYKYRTGLGTNILMMTAVSFLVGLAISGQTFYTFVLENMEKFGALKAIGAKGYELVCMILFQALFTGLTGYGFGVGLCSLLVVIAKQKVPDYTAKMNFLDLGLAFVMVLVIAGISSYVAVRKVIRVEPFDIFRG